MREILFHGKRICEKKNWVEGCLLNLDADSGHVFIVPFFNGASTMPVSRIVECTSNYVNPETVGQFTGLTDQYGAKIWEGDIIRYMKRTMKRHDFTSFEEFEQYVDTQRENGADGYEEVTVVRENGWFKADLMTNTKSAKVAINRFFRVLPELADWKEFLKDSISCGCWKDNDFTMADGSRNTNPSFAWEVDTSNEDMVYIFLNVHEATHLA